MQTTLFHAAVPGGPTGISFQIGDTTLFAPVNEERVYVIDHPAQLLVSAPVPDGMAAFLAETVIGPRLERMGGAPC